MRKCDVQTKIESLQKHILCVDWHHTKIANNPYKSVLDEKISVMLLAYKARLEQKINRLNIKIAS
jgi:hypothetical protein